MSTTLPDFEPTDDCLKDKVIMITGATGGLGSALARDAARVGATVILCGKNLKLLESLYDDIEAAGHPTPAIFPVNQEAASVTDYQEFANTVKNEFGQLHGLVHCAAQLGMPTQIEHYPADTWSGVMAVNVDSAFLITRSLLPIMDTSENASIVFVTDEHNTAFWGAYGASKAALTCFASILADEIEGKQDSNGQPRVCVNTVNPGRMRTKLRANSFAGELPSESPLPETKTSALLYLLSRADTNLHGALINLPDPD